MLECLGLRFGFELTHLLLADNVWHGGDMRSTECPLVIVIILRDLTQVTCIRVWISWRRSKVVWWYGSCEWPMFGRWLTSARDRLWSTIRPSTRRRPASITARFYLRPSKSECVPAHLSTRRYRRRANDQRSGSAVSVSLLSSPPPPSHRHHHQHNHHKMSLSLDHSLAGWVAQWQNVGLWPANFLCPALDL